MFVTCNTCQKSHDQFHYRPTSNGFEAMCVLCENVSMVSWTDFSPQKVGQESQSGKHTVSLTECPKCYTENSEGSNHCSACGLSRSLWSTWEQNKRDANPALLELWKALENDWNNDSRHQKLAQICREKSELSWLASKYRKKGNVSPGDDVCKTHLENIAKQAQLFMLKEQTGGDVGRAKVAPRKSRKWSVIIVVGLLLLFGLFGYLFSKRTTPNPNKFNRLGTVFERLEPAYANLPIAAQIEGAPR